MGLYISDLVLECTRRCNMKCEHCMRGCSQPLDMSYETLRKTLRQIDSISCLAVTGGEPSLKPDFFKDLYDLIRDFRIDVQYFYVVTNAKSTYRRQEFIEHLNNLYEWCDEKDMCSLVVSQDQFHNRLREPNFKYYETEWGDELPYFRKEERREAIYEPLNEGYSESNGIGIRDPKPQEKWEVYKWDNDSDLQVSEGMVYISANGNITSQCDMSYHRIDKEAQGNIHNEYMLLEDVILNYSIKYFEDKEVATFDIEEEAA